MTIVQKVNRRRFLTATGVTAAAALAAGATQVDWGHLMSAAQENPLDPDAGVLVVVTLYGGNDGLNTVVPAGDPAYQAARSELAYRPEEVLDLGEGLGLNPGMKGFKGLWDSKQLAVLRGVGYPKPDHSHFRSMAIWQTASPETSVPTGWLGRWLDATGDDPLRAVSVDPVLPPLLAGERTAAASLPVGGLTLPEGALGKAFEDLGTPQPGEGFWQARAARSVTDLHRAVATLGKPGDAGKKAKGELAAQLDVVAGLIEAGVPTRAYSVSLGGFDTHADERGTQQRLLTDLDGALTPFVQRLAKSDRGKQATVLVYSEFGRRVTANASQGTDHGTAGPVFVLGPRVQGGFHGAEPSLTDLDDGDLKLSTDFRDVYATLVEDVLGTDAGQVLAGHSGRIEGLFA
ncbi:Uncharacterized conserved protein, DUF1501 family [Amycolatopsis pretoriensis]|uniref:Uncharacterized conserved protein, DUF1501 family n=1 Tax=Amycolatopsis pretoriensis TaxID=218821 RepID=A0A1H5RGY5_9PSEU|nr:DUF1501 domain-containing protein [Amycolatopsis pretoriensis]SEF37580.1 Uncharacterized conserved protein, DUF1501 family [Amycolatopsis pretoriensis]